MKKKHFLLVFLIALLTLGGATTIDAKSKKNRRTKARTHRVVTHRYMYTIGNCNFRTGPGTNYPVKYSIPDGVKIYVLYRQGDWYKCIVDEDVPVWTHVQNLRY